MQRHRNDKPHFSWLVTLQPNELGSYLFGAANLIRSGRPKPSTYRGGNIGSTEPASTTAPGKADYHSLHRRLVLTEAI